MAVRQSRNLVGPSATFNLDTQVGNTLVVILSADPTGIGSVTLTDSKGNSVSGARKVNYTGGGGISSLTIWVLENIANAGASHTLSVSGVSQPDFCTLTIAEISLATTSSYDAAVTATASDTDGSPYTVTTGTPTRDSDLVIGVITSEGSTALDYSASGWTRIHQNADFTTFWGQAVFTKSAGDTAETLSVTATGGAATQLLAAIGIKQIVFPVVLPFEQKTAAIGASVTFAPTYRAAPTAFQWKRNGSIISGATSATYTIPVVSAGENGALYSVTATNSLGTSVEVGARLFVSGLNTGDGRAARGWAYQRHQLGIGTPVVIQDRDDWGGAALGDWFSLAAPSFAPRYIPGGGTFDPSIFDPAIFDAPVMAQQLDGITQVATLAGVTTPRSLSAAQTLADVAQAATMAVPGTLTAAQALSPVSQAATLGAPASVSASQNLVSVTQSATMVTVAQLSAAQFLDGAIQSATVTSSMSLSGAQILAGVSQAATLQQVPVAIVAAQVLAGVTQAASLAALASVQAAQTLQPLAQSAAVTSSSALVGAQVLAGVTQTAALALLARVSAAQALAPVSQAGVLAAVPFGVSAAQVLQPITQAATLDASMRLAAAQQLADVIQSATMTARSALQAAQVLAPVVQSAVLVRPSLSSVSAAQALAGIVQSAALRALASVQAAQTLDDITQVGLFLPPYVFQESERVFYVPGENRAFLVAPEERGFLVAPEDRDFMVADEDRGFRVAPEDREFEVPPEPRAFLVN